MWCIDQEKDCYEKLQKLFSKYNHIVDAVMVIYLNLSVKEEIF